MNKNDIYIGMKVVPHSKTCGNFSSLSECIFFKKAQERKQPYLFVIDFSSFSDVITLSCDRESTEGNFYKASDFEPYREEPKQEVLTPIESLVKVINSLEMKKENIANSIDQYKKQLNTFIKRERSRPIFDPIKSKGNWFWFWDDHYNKYKTKPGSMVRPFSREEIRDDGSHRFYALDESGMEINHGWKNARPVVQDEIKLL